MASQDIVSFDQSLGFFGPIDGCTRQVTLFPLGLIVGNLRADVASDMIVYVLMMEVMLTAVNRFRKALDSLNLKENLNQLGKAPNSVTAGPKQLKIICERQTGDQSSLRMHQRKQGKLHTLLLTKIVTLPYIYLLCNKYSF